MGRVSNQPQILFAMVLPVEAFRSFAPGPARLVPSPASIILPSLDVSCMSFSFTRRLAHCSSASVRSSFSIVHSIRDIAAEQFFPNLVPERLAHWLLQSRQQESILRYAPLNYFPAAWLHEHPSMYYWLNLPSALDSFSTGITHYCFGSHSMRVSIPDLPLLYLITRQPLLGSFLLSISIPAVSDPVDLSYRSAPSPVHERIC